MKACLAWAVALLVATLPGCKSPPPSCEHCEAPSAATPPSASQNHAAALDGFQFTTHEGKPLRFGDLKGAPLAVSFIYTRCQNQRKCPLVARTMAQLRSDIDNANVTPVPRLALITYDPEYDTPARLEEFGVQFGLLSSTNTLLLRPSPATKMDLFQTLNVAVNFNAGGVNLHGIQLLVFDAYGVPARAYRGLIWDNSKVVADLKTLVAAQSH